MVRPLEPGQDEDDFFGFLDMLTATRSPFMEMRQSLLRAYTAKKFYVIDIWFSASRDEIYEGPRRSDKTLYLTPGVRAAFYAKTCDVLWVHPACRRRGYGRYLVEELNLTTVSALPEVRGFWERLGFHHVPEDDDDEGAVLSMVYTGPPRREKKRKLEGITQRKTDV